ncbi:MAG: c-type cytochrome [Gammaproteobacteria bacterium]|nr:c-type cytochrome [Gammaproteobacteria bacterium]MDE0368082.1 c-type cytochrome [Gammaproteobacteria bacterium]
MTCSIVRTRERFLAAIVSRRCRALLPLLVLHWFPTAAQADELERVGRGDGRSGYESIDYVTDSRRIGALGASSARLHAFAADPPLGLPPMAARQNVTAAGIELGRRLFFDRRLSFNDTLSCANCHVPEQGFTQNELRTPVGIEGRSARRNAPALYNVAYREALFFDGREENLEQQIWSPLLAANEMGNPSVGTVLRRLRELGDYDAEFQALYGEGIGMETLGRALAEYQRALLSANSPFDRWFFAGEADALPESAKRGFALFLEAGCSGCHQIQDGHAHFTDDDFHNTGLGFHRAMEPGRRVQLAPGVFVDREDDIPVPRLSDLGRYEATGRPQDRWKFRTPSLRNVAVTAPYMHDGSLSTLAAVIDFYDAGGVPNEGLDPRIRALDLTPEQKQDLIAFLESLNGSNLDALAADARLAPIGDRN